MRMPPRILLTALITTLGIGVFAQQKNAPPSAKECPVPTATTDKKYEPGQVWNYKTRAGETSSTLTILKVESLPQIGTIIHVRIDNIRLYNCAGGNSPQTIEHAPFTRDAVDSSVTKLVRKIEVPSFEEGYANWRQDCGGVYTIPVAKMLDDDEHIFQKGLGCGEDKPAADRITASR